MSLLPRREALRPPSDAPFAVLDIGSNSVRLVIFQLIGAFPVTLFNESVSCRLGRSVERTGRLDPPGVRMALENLGRFAAVGRAMGVKRLEALATAAVREARDGADFVRRAEKAIGVKIRILSGDEEALVSARGVLAGIYDARGLVCDLGGASLEMAAVADGAVGRRETLPLGPMRLASHSPARLRPLERRIAKELDCVGWIDAERGETLYLVGGAWRALARAYMHLTDYPVKVVHYFGLSRTRAMEAADTVLRVDPAILRAVPKMSGKRLETMPYAALTLRQLLRRVGPEEVVFSTYGLREGWVFGDFAPNGPGRDWFLAACRDYRHWAIRASLPAETLAAWAAPMFPTAHHREQRLFLGACHLSNLGWADHPEDRAYHVLSRCLRLAVPGIDHAGRAFIALALYRRYNGDLDDERIAKFDPLLRKEERHRAIVLGSALRLAYALSGGDEEVLAASRLELKGRKLTLELQEQVRPFLGDGVHRRIAELGRSLGVKTQIVVKEARVAGARAPRRRAG